MLPWMTKWRYALFIGIYTLDAVLPVVSAQAEDFGTLSDYGLIYYRDGSSDTASIALTDTAYIGSSMADLLLALVEAVNAIVLS